MASFHLITLIVVVMAYSSSALIDINKCISYRYLPCIDGKSQDPTPISKDETIIKYIETTCIVYQFLPCQNGSKSLSLMYNNGSSKDPSTSCQNQTAPASTVLQTKSFCEPSLTSANDWVIRYYKSFIEKKSLSDDFLKYLVSVFNTRIIDEEAEKFKPFKDRMQDYIGYSVARLGLRELVDVPKLIPDYGVVYNDILSFKYPINIPACYNNGAATSSVPSLFVAVTGVAMATDKIQNRRDEIRTLFNKEIPDLLKKNLFSSINFAFFLDKPEDSAIQNSIQQESAKNKDVVQVDMIDTGRNGSLKLAAIFNWVRQFCGNVNVVFKMDENFEIATLKKLGTALTGKSIPGTFVYGVKKDIRPQRVGKRMITMEEFPWTDFPSYLNGLAYFITGNMIEPLMAAFQTVPMLPLEDVYLGICIIKSGMKRSTICGTDIDFSSCF